MWLATDREYRPTRRHPADIVAEILRLLVFTAVVVVATPGNGTAQPYVPADDGMVLERLPAPGDSIKRELRKLRAELKEDPENLDLATRLARRYIELGRAESDPRYGGYAEAVLRPWWTRANPPVDVLVLRATLRQSRHEFDAALDDLSQVLTADRRNPQAWLTRAVIFRVLGRYAEASDSCVEIGTFARPFVATACKAAVESLNGRAAESYDRLRSALSNASSISPGLRLWALTNLAEIAARAGDAGAAEKHFREALSLDVRNAYLLGAYADFLLDEDRPEEVRDMLAGEARADGLLLRLALAEERLNDPKFSDHVAALEARFAANRMRGGAVHLRDEARFTLHLLNRPGEALRLAKQNWRQQREPWDSRLVLEAALASRTRTEAQEILDWLEKSGLEDARIESLAQQLNRTES